MRAVPSNRHPYRDLAGTSTAQAPTAGQNQQASGLTTVERPALEVAGIFRRHGAAYPTQHRLPLEQHRLMRAIEVCRTAALGGHVERCGHCPYQRISYNSCHCLTSRNRHCPKCRNRERSTWLARRKAELLPVEYFHVVFTIPEQLNRLALANKETVYKILFKTSAETL